MGHRLSKITTRTGDAGETGLGDGTRVAKDSARVAALGDIDELSSAIGVMLAEEVPAEIRQADQIIERWKPRPEAVPATPGDRTAP